MSLTYYAGSQAPSSSDITTLLAQTIGNSTPNEIEIILDALNLKSYTKSNPGSQQTCSQLLP